MLSVTVISDAASWDQIVGDLGGHPLQLWGWGAAKEHGPWTAHRVVIRDGERTVGGAQILVRKLPAPFGSLAYVPRGPVVSEDGDPSAVVGQVATWAKANLGGIGISFEPDWPAGTQLQVPGLAESANRILYPHTLIVDLTQSIDELLADMSKATRKNVRRAERIEVEFREVASDEEFLACLPLYHETARRAGFAIHPDEYYLTVRRELGHAAPAYAAFAGDEPIAFLMLAASPHTSFELYAGNNEAGHQARANSGLKWLAMTAMKERGVVRYDFNGLLGEGITRFKTSFASHTDDLMGTWDVPFSPLYTVWTKALPTARKAMRRFKTRG